MFLTRHNVIGLVAVITAIVVVLQPGAIYAVSLALFGLPHVLFEFRYVDERFGSRLNKRTLTGLIALLSLVLMVRFVGFAGATNSHLGTVELSLVAGLITVSLLQHRNVRAQLAAFCLATCVVYGIFAAPATTLLLFAIAHNVTPVGFIAEILRGQKRRRVLMLCGFVFLIIPLLIISGFPQSVLAQWGLLRDAGGEHFGAFVPEPWLNQWIAPRLFAAAVYLQCAHYAAVLLVLPKLGGTEHGRGLLLWPKPKLFVCLVALLGIGLSFAYSVSFYDARAFYGIFAAIHAWIELPILLIALGGTQATTNLVGPTA